MKQVARVMHMVRSYLLLVLLLALEIAAPAFAAHEYGPVGPYNVSFDMNTTENYSVIVDAPVRGVTSDGVNYTRHNLTVDSSDHVLFLILTRYDEPMLINITANITANTYIVWNAFMSLGLEEPVLYSVPIDGQPGALGSFRFQRAYLSDGQYEEGDLITIASYSPDGKVYEDGVYRGKTDCRVISTFPWEVIRDMLNSLHVQAPD